MKQVNYGVCNCIGIVLSNGLRPIASSPSDIQHSLLFPLFTPSGGKPFDDGTYAIVPPVASVRSLTVHYNGDYIDGLQVT